MSRYYDYFEEQRHTDGEVSVKESRGKPINGALKQTIPG